MLRPVHRPAAPLPGHHANHLVTTLKVPALLWDVALADVLDPLLSDAGVDSGNGRGLLLVAAADLGVGSDATTWWVLNLPNEGVAAW